jgi:hypothetical protein
LRIAGTGWQIQPDADGHFEFREMPLGAKFEIVAWDVNNVMSRRIVPVSVDGVSDVHVDLEKSSFADALGLTFGVRQDLTQSGFCARLAASDRDLLIGAKVTVQASEGWQGPFFFNENKLPDPGLAEATRDGRFCVFNAKSDLVDVAVRLLNGMRRTFTVRLKPSTFEAGLTFEMDRMVHRPAMLLELVDAFEAFDSTNSAQKMRFGRLSTRRWLGGEESASWARVYGLRLRTDLSYGAVPYEEGNEDDPVYLPMGQEWQEFRVARDEQGAPESFSLVSSGEFLTPAMRVIAQKNQGRSVAVVDAKDPLVVRAMDADTLGDLMRTVPGADQDPNLGAAFVSLDLAGLEVDYADLRLSLRDAWTGQSVAPFHFVPAPKGAKNPRQVRGFFTNIPEGQFTVLVTDKGGALRWLDVVRSRPGSLQVLSVRE